MVRWEWIIKVKEIFFILVIVNGDIFFVDVVICCLEEIRVDGVMCFCGILGYFFLVGEIDYFLKNGVKKVLLIAVEKLECVKEYLWVLWEYKGDCGIC